MTPTQPAAGSLPLIGARPLAEQQRILTGLVGLGLLGLVALTIMSIVSAGRGSAQVAASGQALMQSQRLAKSVSQALVGSAQAFPEVKESAEVLAKNVRSLQTGEGDVAAAPDSVQSALEPVLPLVDRAEKNAATVLAQQKVLTQVGQSLRTINRQSADLLEVAETVSSLKLQRDAAPAELAAVGQLVDADAAHRQVGQRIPDDRRREPGGGLPARQGPELVPRSRRRPARRQRRSCACRAPRIRRRASAWPR